MECSLAAALTAAYIHSQPLISKPWPFLPCTSDIRNLSHSKTHIAPASSLHHLGRPVLRKLTIDRGSPNWLLGKVVRQLSDGLVTAYVDSAELGLNMEQIKSDLMFTQGLLHEAHLRRDVSNPGLPGLLEILSKKADEAEDTLDELHYFIIQDQIDGTHEATPVVGSGIRGQALHGRHVLHRTIGTCVDLKDQLKKLEASTPDDLLIHARRKTLQHWKGEQASKRWQQRHQRQQGFAGGSAESDMHSLARESRTTGEGLAFGPAMATPVGVTFLLGRCCVFYPLPMGSPGENHFLSKTSGCGATGVVSSLEASFIRSIP
uniref:Rx N-terminal domain-containing protein n=1 Tax=Oryza punctata TaxID=4537 RepID=A0A0E0JY65_ORYPU